MQESPAWYAVWTRSRHEHVVREQLERKGLEAFLPTITRWSRWKDRKKQIDWPLFPGYCFARFDARERLPILKCAGVVSIVSFDGDIAPIPEHEIESLVQGNSCGIGCAHPRPRLSSYPIIAAQSNPT